MFYRQTKMRISVAGVLLAAAVAVTAAQSLPQKAKGYYFNKKYEIALVTLLRAVQQVPDSSELYLYIGNIYTHKKQFAQALKFYKIGLDLTAAPGVFLFNMGQANHYSKKYRAALSCYTQAMRKGDAPAEVYLEMGRSFYQLSDRTNTVRSWKKYMKKAPRNSQADTIRKAIVLLESGKLLMPAQQRQLAQQKAAAKKKKQQELRRRLQKILQNSSNKGGDSGNGQQANTTNRKPLVNGENIKAKLKDKDTKSKGRENYDGKEGLEE